MGLEHLSESLVIMQKGTLWREAWWVLCLRALPLFAGEGDAGLLVEETRWEVV